MIWLIYSAGFRNEGARALYPVDDPFRDRKTEHFIGFGAEWWFGSTSYGGGP
jgi:maltoporin